MLTICLFILGSFFISGPVQAYVLQGLHLLDLMIEQLGEARSLYVTQELTFYRVVSQTDIETDEPQDEHQTLDKDGVDLPADQRVQLDENVSLEEMLQLDETLRFYFPFAFRSDAKSSDSERIHVVSGDRSITIVDGSIVPAVTNRFDLYKDIFLFYSLSFIIYIYYLRFWFFHKFKSIFNMCGFYISICIFFNPDLKYTWNFMGFSIYCKNI